MLKLRKNKRNDLYIFFGRHDPTKAYLTAKFQEDPMEQFREIVGRIYGIRPTFQFWRGEKMLVKKLGVNALLLMLCKLHFSKSFQSDNHVYCDLNKSTLDFFIWFYRTRLLNSEIVLVLVVQLLYVIHQIDYLTGQNRQIQANSDCQGHNGTDINCLACVQVCILITCLKKLNERYEADNRESKQDTVFCYLYTQGCHKIHKRPRRFLVFFLIILFILTINSLRKSVIES